MQNYPHHRGQTDGLDCRRRRLLPRRKRTVLFLVGFSVLLHGLVTVASGPMISQDSPRYAAIGGSSPPLDILGTHGAAAPLVQIVWRLPLPMPLVIQALASCSAWAFVTFLALAVIRSRPLAAVAAVILTGAFWSPLVLFADATILTESLAISGSLACLSGALCLVNAQARSVVPLRLACVATVAGFGVAILSRPVTLVFLAPAVALCLAIALCKGRQLAVLLSITLALAILSYGLALSANASQSPTGAFRAANRLALRASPAWIEAARRTGFRDCPSLTSAELISSAAKGYTWTSFGPVNFRQSSRGPDIDAANTVQQTSCPGISEWLKAGHLTPAEQVIYTPRDTISGYLADLPRFWLERSLGEGMPLRAQRAAPLVTLAFTTTAVALLCAAALKSWRQRRDSAPWGGGLRIGVESRAVINESC